MFMNWNQRPGQHNTTASLTMIMSLFQTMNTFSRTPARLLFRVLRQETTFSVGDFYKTSRFNEVKLLVLPSMSHHFVGVCAYELTFQAMEMRRLVVRVDWNFRTLFKLKKANRKRTHQHFERKHSFRRCIA